MPVFMLQTTVHCLDVVIGASDALALEKLQHRPEHEQG
jgi:hypothetical protein